MAKKRKIKKTQAIADERQENGTGHVRTRRHCKQAASCVNKSNMTGSVLDDTESLSHDDESGSLVVVTEAHQHQDKPTCNNTGKLSGPSRTFLQSLCDLVNNQTITSVQHKGDVIYVENNEWFQKRGGRQALFGMQKKSHFEKKLNRHHVEFVYSNNHIILSHPSLKFDDESGSLVVVTEAHQHQDKPTCNNTGKVSVKSRKFLRSLIKLVNSPTKWSVQRKGDVIYVEDNEWFQNGGGRQALFGIQSKGNFERKLSKNHVEFVYSNNHIILSHPSLKFDDESGSLVIEGMCQETREERALAFKNAKENSDESGSPIELARVLRRTRSVQFRIRMWGDSPGILNLIERLLALCPELLALLATDGHLDAYGYVHMNLKMASANAVWFIMNQVHVLKRLLPPPNMDQPPYLAGFLFKYVGLDGKLKGKTRQYERVQHSEKEKIKVLCYAGQELNDSRQEVQELHELQTDEGVMARLRNGSDPVVTLEDLRVVFGKIQNAKLRTYLTNFLDNSDKLPDIEDFLQALHGGLFYAHISSVDWAFWGDVFVNLGFGSSKGKAFFNQPAWQRIVNAAPNLEEFRCRYLLAFANFDGSILPEYFEVIVPRDDTFYPSPSVKKMMVNLFEELFGFKPRCYNKKSDGKKRICCLRIKSREKLAQIAETLLPYANDCLTYDRKKNLLGYLDSESEQSLAVGASASQDPHPDGESEFWQQLAVVMKEGGTFDPRLQLEFEQHLEAAKNTAAEDLPPDLVLDFKLMSAADMSIDADDLLQQGQLEFEQMSAADMSIDADDLLQQGQLEFEQMLAADMSIDADDLPQQGQLEFEPMLTADMNTVATQQQYRGLINLGNTCYQNASLQMLVSCQHFMTRLHQACPPNNNSSSDADILTRAVCNVARDLELRPFWRAADPVTVKDAMDRKTTLFTGFQQRDAHEFMSKLVVCLRSEVDSLQPPQNNPIDDFYLTARVCLKCRKCGYTRHQIEEYHHLSLPIGASVEHSLALFFQPEECEYKCVSEKVCTGTSIDQTLRILERPKILVLHLKRFKWVANDAEKDKTKVKIPLTLTLDSYLDSPESDKMTQVYLLQSIVYHTGETSDSGHYVADAVRPDPDGATQDVWYHFDDKEVKRLRNGEVVVGDSTNQATAYILLYTLKEDSPVAEESEDFVIQTSNQHERGKKRSYRAFSDDEDCVEENIQSSADFHEAALRDLHSDAARRSAPRAMRSTKGNSEFDQHLEIAKRRSNMSDDSEIEYSSGDDDDQEDEDYDEEEDSVEG